MLTWKAFYLYDGDLEDEGLHVEQIKAKKFLHAQAIAKELEQSSKGELKLIGLRETLACSRWK